ncbi:hypothetical protein BCR32DRAFT_295889 [Anaeromyces robustus]|uniref:Uncharacterized protein n=1 Tax=Anaeromyces robustus TaxID=1754192 RepID=A0A1Y1WTZ3_9FUNG|nr:hypothetical protein BCR32DRAFT_295889 [Anaeromyces robustus]|eukprot:ORX77007.1 hypothetical protein BCR32DRAFT_295889 [Anaeromyces robustus]
MEEQSLKKETTITDDEILNTNSNNLFNSQDKDINQHGIKENNIIKKSPFFFDNFNTSEKKKNVHNLKLDKKKLKLHSNKKIKKSNTNNKKSSQNLFALSFFKNLNEKSKLNSTDDNNQEDINRTDDNEISNTELQSKNKDNISLSQSSQNSIKKKENDNVNISLNEKENQINENAIDVNREYESQYCPICNKCLDFYTFSEREKHVNLCIDSSIRKENRKNNSNKLEDNKISFFYKNIKTTNINEEKEKEKEKLTEFITTAKTVDKIQTEPYITNTLQDINNDTSSISELLPSNYQFKCKICDEGATFSSIIDLYLHIFQCFSKVEQDHFFFKEKINFILNQKECFCCLKPWPIYEEKAAHIKECISIRKNYLEKIEILIKYYLKEKFEKNKAFLDKNSKYRHYFKKNKSIYLKKEKPDSIPAKVTEIKGQNQNSESKKKDNQSIFNLDLIQNKNGIKEKDGKRVNSNDDINDINDINDNKIEEKNEKMEEETEEYFNKKCCFCNEEFKDDSETLEELHIEKCIKNYIEKMDSYEKGNSEIEDTNIINNIYKPKYIQKLTRCPCCSKKWLEYSMADLKEKLSHIYDCSKKNEVPLARISIILNQYKSRFKDEKEGKENDKDKGKDKNSNSNSNSTSTLTSSTTTLKSEELNKDSDHDRTNVNDNNDGNGSDENLFDEDQKIESIKKSINERKLHRYQDDNNVVVLNIEDENTEDFKTNIMSLKLSSSTSSSLGNVRTYRQRTLYDDIEEDQIKLAKVLSKSLYQDENQKIRLKIMNTSTVLSVEDAHTYNFKRANSLLNLMQQEHSLWEMSMLNTEDVLKAETVIEPLQKHSHELRMTLNSEGIDEYISTITFPVPDRRLLKVNSIEGIDKYFNEQIKNRKIRLDKYKKLLTLQTSLWIKKMRKKQHLLKKELISIDLENPDAIKNTRIYHDLKSEMNPTFKNDNNIYDENNPNNSNSNAINSCQNSQDYQDSQDTQDSQNINDNQDTIDSQDNRDNNNNNYNNDYENENENDNNVNDDSNNNKKNENNNVNEDIKKNYRNEDNIIPINNNGSDNCNSKDISISNNDNENNCNVEDSCKDKDRINDNIHNNIYKNVNEMNNFESYNDDAMDIDIDKE